jgi:hypothetical protein
MTGCGKPWNGQHKVVGLPLRCGVSLYWRLKNSKPNDKAREQETLLCPLCEEK